MKTLYRVEVHKVFYVLAENEGAAESAKDEAFNDASGDDTRAWIVSVGDALADGWDGGCLVYHGGPYLRDVPLSEVWPGGFPGGDK